jgi:hypothetical protein
MASNCADPLLADPPASLHPIAVQFIGRFLRIEAKTNLSGVQHSAESYLHCQIFPKGNFWERKLLEKIGVLNIPTTPQEMIHNPRPYPLRFLRIYSFLET